MTRPDCSPLRGLARLVAVALLVWASGARAQDGAAPLVLSLQLADHGDRTRLVLEMTAAVPFQLERQTDPDRPTSDRPASDRPASDRPASDRLVITFAGVEWRSSADPPGAGLITGYHQAVEDGRLRLVLDLGAPVRVRGAFYLPAAGPLPYRFVLDLEPVSAGATMAAGQNADTPRQAAESAVPAPATAPAPVAATAPVAANPDAPADQPTPAVPGDPALPLIVLDPGHGGADPGTTGRTGLHEKEVTLAVARRLRAALQATGRYRVLMTRDSDEFVSLRQRVRIARNAGADLLLSLHADSNPDRALRGVSVYTLSERASDREAAALAARENRSEALAGVALDPEDDATAGILIDLAQRETRTESGALAEALLHRLGEQAELLVHSHREAGLIVLKAPDVPSVLVELGHLSHRQEERLLATPQYQQQLAEAMVGAIDDYFEWHRTVARSPG